MDRNWVTTKKQLNKQKKQNQKVCLSTYKKGLIWFPPVFYESNSIALNSSIEKLDSQALGRYNEICWVSHN